MTMTRDEYWSLKKFQPLMFNSGEIGYFIRHMESGEQALVLDPPEPHGQDRRMRERLTERHISHFLNGNMRIVKEEFIGINQYCPRSLFLP